MSTGPVTTEKKRKPTVDTARQWCDEARSILSLTPLGTDQRNLKSASDKSHKLLTKLDELNHGELTEAQQRDRDRYLDTAAELQRLQLEYRKQQLLKKDAKGAIKGRFLTDTRKLSKNQWEGEIKRAEQAMEEVKALMRAETTKLEQLNVDLQSAVDTKEEQLKRQRARVTDKTQIAVIDAAEKGIATGRKLMAYFAKNCDSGTAKEIADAYQPYATLDWYGATDRETKRDEVLALNTNWENRKKLYATNKKVYKGAKKDARAAMAGVEEMLPAEQRGDILQRYYLGQDAALRKQWDVAGANINPALVEELKQLLGSVQTSFDEWQVTKTERYTAIRRDIDKMTDATFITMALANLAEVVAETERTKKYSKGVTDFTTARNKAQAVLAVYELANQTLIKFVETQTTSETLVSGLAGENLSFALPLKAQLDEQVESFRKAQHVETLGELNSVIAEHEKEINRLKGEIEACGDDLKVAAMTKQVEDSRDAGKFVAPLAAKIEAVHNKIFEFEGLAANPTGDAQLVADWKNKLATARKALEGLEKSSSRGTTQNFERHKQTYIDQNAALDLVLTAVTDKHTLAESSLETSRTALLTSLRNLDKKLSDNRWQTFREATWHADAVLEAAQLRSLATSGSIGLLNESKTRADEMLANATKAFEYYLKFYSEDELPDMRYRNHKDALSALLKRLKKKSLKRTLPAEHGKVLGKVLEAESDIRTAGPGQIDKMNAPWTTLINELTTEVDALFAKLTLIEGLRTACENLVKSIRADIGGKLAEALKAKSGKAVSPDHLPITGKLEAIEGGILAEDADELRTVQKKLQNLRQELDFSIDEVNDGDFAELVKASDASAAKERKQRDAELEIRAEYQDTLPLLTKLLETLKDTSNIDKVELKRIDKLYRDAMGKAKTRDFSGARTTANLAFKLAKQLQADPLASQTTGRGREHLKELNPRWTGSVQTLLDSVAKLSAAIGKSSDGDPDVASPAAIVDPFNAAVLDKMKKDLELGAFQQELLVLAADPPKKDAAKAKDEAKKRKIREQALAKLRRYRDIVHKSPLYTTVVMQNNPWSGKGGAVIGLPLLRALNDLDLNIQRAV